jgi:hypothetical protein
MLINVSLAKMIKGQTKKSDSAPDDEYKLADDLL